VSGKDDGHSEEQPKVVIRDRRRIDPETGAPREVAVSSVGGDAAGANTPAAPGGTGSGTAQQSQAHGGSGVKAGSTSGPGAGGDAADPNESGGDVSAQGSSAVTGPGGAQTSAGTQPADKGENGEKAKLVTELGERTADLQRITAEYANYRRRIERDRQLTAEVTTGSVLTALLPVLDDIDRARQHGDLNGAFAAVAEQLATSLTKLGLTPFGEAGDAFDPTYHEAVAHTTSPDVTETTCVEVFRKGYSLGDRLLRAAMVVVADPAEGDTSGSAGGTRAGGSHAGATRSTDDGGPGSSGDETASATAGPGATGDAAGE
jgi:molecular chaperone GrpE